MKISKELSNYIYRLKISKKNNIYETVCLMILNNIFLEALEELILSNKKNIEKSIKGNKNISSIDIKTSLKYNNAVNLVCCSKYFINTFSKEEIERKKEIALNIIIEIAVSLFIKEVINKNKIESIKFKDVFVNHYLTKMPCIEHEVYKEKNIEKIKINFLSTTPLNEIIDYLKMIGIKNTPKKKKLKLGQAIRLLIVEEDIKNNKKKYQDKIYKQIGESAPSKYLEELISREMNDVYSENLSEELINKSLQRIKKIKKEINIIGDK